MKDIRPNKHINSLFVAIAAPLLFQIFAGLCLAAPGALDMSFGYGGIVITDLGGSEICNGIAIQPDGKVVAVGKVDRPALGTNISIVRYNVDGSLDQSFGIGGKVITDLGGYEEANDVELQSDGKIVIGGIRNDDFVLVRYHINGTLDSTFGSGGSVITDFSGLADWAQAIMIQPDGRIVAAGTANIGLNVGEFGLVRYNPNGTLDPTFGIGGILTTEIGPRVDQVNDLALQSDGKLVAAGYTSAVNNQSGWNLSDSAMVRYNPNGSLDTTFGTGGKVVRDVVDDQEDAINALVIDPDGKILTAGYTSVYDIPYPVLFRYNLDGSLEPTTFSSFDFGIFNDIAIQANGKIVAAGELYPYNGLQGWQFGLARYNSDGTLDANFGTGGIVATDVRFNDAAKKMAILPDGRILTAGFTYFNSYDTGDFALARYIGDPVAQRTRFDFDGDGRADISVFRPSNRVWYLNNSTTGFRAFQFGLSTDQITPADYDGDGRTDVAVYRDGIWYRINSSNGTVSIDQFGIANDIPVPADLTGDGRSELTIFRNGIWWSLDLANNNLVTVVQFGTASDRPVAADYDGDGRSEHAVYRNGEWHLNRSTLGYTVLRFGLANDTPVIADYDGDGKTDIAVYREGIWYLQQSSNGFTAFQFGLATDTPTPADYDGDGKADAAIYRNGQWWLRQSTSGVTVQQFGLPNDKPIPAAFLP